jgi:hypothetical protein
MATPEHRRETTLVGSFGAVARVGLVGVFTGVETLALVLWLAVVEGAPLASQATAVGLTILVAGFVLEHVLTDVAVNGFDLSFPSVRILGISLSEAILWVLWLVVAELVGGLAGLLAAAAVLAVLLVPQHTVEDNVLRGRRPLSSLFNPGTVGFSVVEAVGSTIWLFLVFRGAEARPVLLDLGLAGVRPEVLGVAVLAGTLFVEHVTGVMFSDRG